MVDRSRIYPSIFILFFISFFYLVKSDFLFISILGLFIIYDLIISKILNFTFSFLLFILLFFSMVLFYFYDFLFINEVFLIFLVSLFFLIISKKYKNLFFSFSVFLILYLSFNILVQERYLFFFIISLSFTNDTLAFFSGKFFKGPLIVPKISPKKTWSGTLISIIFIFLILIFLEYDYLFSLLVSVSFFLGDILFSYFKRQQNIKDFSNLLKGHGGFLDRFDSIFFPIFLFNIYII